MQLTLKDDIWIWRDAHAGRQWCLGGSLPDGTFARSLAATIQVSRMMRLFGEETIGRLDTLVTATPQLLSEITMPEPTTVANGMVNVLRATVAEFVEHAKALDGAATDLSRRYRVEADAIEAVLNQNAELKANVERLRGALKATTASIEEAQLDGAYWVCQDVEDSNIAALAETEVTT